MSRGGKKNVMRKAGGAAPKQAPSNGKQKMVQTKEKVLKKRVTGKVISWKGTSGWVQLDQAIDYAGAKKSKIYMAAEDVEEDLSGVGASVSFFVWNDGKGLAAKNIKKGGGGGAPNGGKNTAGKQQQKNNAGGGQTQARQKIGGQRYTGTVKEWKGSFGFILPSSKINHPDASKKGGKIYFNQADVEAQLSGEGATVSFLLYKDKTGLGACNVRPGKAAGNQAINPGKHGKSGKQGTSGKQPEQMVKNDKLKKKRNRNRKGKERKEPAPLDKSKRSAVSGETMTGTVLRTSGDRVAWLKPESDIDHPKFAEKKFKSLFLHKDDVDGEFPKVGATVQFTVYEDDRGIGAESVQIVTQGTGQLPEDLKAEAKEFKKESKKNRREKAKEQKKSGVKVGAFAKKQSEKNKGKNKGKNKQKKGGEKKEKGPSGPDLPRERISDTPVSGEVITMGRTFGWVRASEPVEHEAGKKHGGKIYLHKKDIVDGSEIKKGSTVTFHIYADSSGLGAEECS